MRRRSRAVLLDAYGRPAPRATAAGGGPAYRGGGSGRRFAGLPGPNVGPTRVLRQYGDALRRRSRQLVRDNPWAANGVEAWVANAIGTGIMARSLAPDAAFRAAADRVFDAWTAEADASGFVDWYGMQALAVRAMLEAGEVFVRVRPREERDGLAVPLQLQVLEAEHCPIDLNRALGNGNVIRAGVEFSPIGRVVAYHFTREHPGEDVLRDAGATTDTVAVPARFVRHLFRPLRPGQVRGEPWLARVLLALSDFDEYTDAERVRKKTTAMFGGFVRVPDRDDARNVLGEDTDDDDDAEGGATVAMEPGTFPYLAPGEDVTFAEPTDVGGSFEPFTTFNLRAVAAGLGIPYEALTWDLSKVNYSSIRAGTLEFRRRVEAVVHQVIVHRLCRPVWEDVLRAAVLAGTLDAAAFGRDPRAALAARWFPQGWAWVDPQKEIAAQIAAIRAGLTSRSAAIAETGEAPELVDAEIAADAARADALGLVLDSDPRRVQGSGAYQPGVGTDEPDVDAPNRRTA